MTLRPPRFVLKVPLCRLGAKNGLVLLGILLACWLRFAYRYMLHLSCLDLTRTSKHEGPHFKASGGVLHETTGGV